MLKRIFLCCIVSTVLFLFAQTKNHALAADTLVFDSTDNYLGACQFTDKSSWTLSQDINVSTFQIWYSWNQNENTLPVKVYKDNVLFAEFEAKRSSCDTYQKQWCNADFVINKVFPIGLYTTQIDSPRQCLKPGGTGAVRLYTSDSLTNTAEEQLTNTPTLAVSPAISPEPKTSADLAKETSCSCNSTLTLAIAVGTSSVVSAVISVLLRKRN